MEIDNAIFQDLESFEKGRFFKVAIEKFSILMFGKLLQYPKVCLIYYRIKNCICNHSRWGF